MTPASKRSSGSRISTVAAAFSREARSGSATPQADGKRRAVTSRCEPAARTALTSMEQAGLVEPPAVGVVDEERGRRRARRWPPSLDVAARSTATAPDISPPDRRRDASCRSRPARPARPAATASPASGRSARPRCIGARRPPGGRASGLPNGRDRAAAGAVVRIWPLASLMALGVWPPRAAVLSTTGRRVRRHGPCRAAIPDSG